MSILHAVAAVTTMPSGAAESPAQGESLGVILAVCAWSLIGLLAAYGFGVFRWKSIVGPARLNWDDSAWDLVIIFCMAFSLTSMGAGYVMRQTMNADVKMLVLSAEVSVGAAAVILLLLGLFRPGLLAAVGFNPRRIPSGIAGGAATLFVVYPLVMLAGVVVTMIYHLLHAPNPGAHELLQLLGNTHNRGMMAVTIGLAVIAAPIAEEMMYRGLLQTALVRGIWLLLEPQTLSGGAEMRSSGPPPAMARWGGVLVSSICFAAIHLRIDFFFPLLVLALGLGYVYERTGNLWTNIATHSLFNSAQILFFLAAMH